MKKNLTTLFTLLLLSCTALFGTTHQIVFGYIYYSPDSLNVNVGDEIIWSGDFLVHPLESTSTPPGVAPFSNSTGTSYSYIIPAAGIYRYRCFFHSNEAVIIAGGTTGIHESKIETPEMSIYSNPASNAVTLTFNKSMIGGTVTVIDFTGRTIATFKLGTCNLPLSTDNFANGIYFIAATTTGRRTVTKKLIIQK